MATKTRAQISMEDKIIKNDELEQALEKRQELKQSVSEFRKADKDCRKKIETVQTPMPFRVGRFIISKTAIPPKSVAFETDQTSRIVIKTADE